MLDAMRAKKTLSLFMAVIEIKILIEESDLEKLLQSPIEKIFANYVASIPSPNEPDFRLLNIDEVADLLGVSKSSVNSYKKRGLIPFHRLGRRIYFKRQEVLDCLKKINA